LVGAPGAGKGTLCKMLAEEYGFRHISVGDLLRQIVLSPNADKKTVEYVRRAELLPTETLFSILKSQFGELNGGRTILLDGFPRRLDQAKSFEEVVSTSRFVLFFDCPEGLAEDRVVQRLAGREGDNLETFRKRFEEFSKLNPPILEYYKSKDKLVVVSLRLEDLPTLPDIGIGRHQRRFKYLVQETAVHDADQT
ncbi:adenylate kinase-domain-containing protein, partial [Lineolata rhizophorae]